MADHVAPAGEPLVNLDPRRRGPRTIALRRSRGRSRAARRWTAWLGAAALIALAGLSAAQSGSAQSSTESVDAEAGERARSASRHRAQVGRRLDAMRGSTHPDALIPIRVTLKRRDLPARGAGRRAAIARRQDRILASGALSDQSVRRRYKMLPGFAIVVPASRIEALLRNSDVVAIHLDGEVRMATSEGRGLIGSDTLTALGVRGVGINVAVLDTGFDSDHPDLSSSLVAEQCFCDTHPSPGLGNCCPGNTATASGPGAAEDDEGHGTSVSGIITSDGVVAPLGVAPDAGIVAIKVLSNLGVGSDSDIDAALDWVLDNYDDSLAPIHVVNMSLSDGGEFDSTATSNCSTSPTAVAIADLAVVGVSVFAASGNDGHDSGISAPACVAEAISVGGVYDAALGSVGWCGNPSCTTILCTDTSGPDVFVCHSNSGSLLDILTPDWRTRSPALGGGEHDFGGTSASSPYAAAVAALLLELEPNLTPSDLRTHLVGAGVSVLNPDNSLSFPRVDVVGSVAAALPDCGNGVLDAGEICDDGNIIGGDCCTSICTYEPAASSCSDASVCTTGDQCDGAGNCVGTPIVCDDSNECTDDACDPVLGCGFVPNMALCDDANDCTSGDICSGGSCAPGAPVVCDDANPCTDDSCNPIGGCAFAPNTDPCDDADDCTNGDLCSAGTCVPGSPVICDDVNPCTDDSCNPIGGCAFAPNVAVCDDGSACTIGDLCSGGACMSGSALDCDDEDACTADACDAIEGCSHTPIISCGPPHVPLLGPKGLTGLVLLLGSTGTLMGLMLRRQPFR